MVAVNVIAHLDPTIVGQNDNGNIINRDRCDLKWALQMGYARNIAPEDFVPFDAFGIDETNPTHVYLHSASDTRPRFPIIDKAGKYLLKYEVFSENFPAMELTLLLDLTGNTATTKVELLDRK